ncbi:MAG: outer membrane protein [Polaribacter sp.]|jgi:outer membrane protein
MNKSKIISVTLIASILSVNVMADNLLDIYRLAKDSDPTYLASEAGIRASSERVNQSMAGLLPQISGSLSYSKSSSDSENETTTTSAIDNPLTAVDETVPRSNASSGTSDSTSSGYSINLSQEIYNHSTWLSLKQSEKRELQSKIIHEGAKQKLIIRVAEAYFNVLAAKDSVEFSKAETKAVSQELAQTKQRFEVGLIAITDVLEAQSRYDRALANQIAAQNTLDNTHELLQLITGAYHYDLLTLKKSISLSKPQPETIKTWVKEAEENNIDIKSSKVGLDIAKRNISISQSGHYPTLGLSASYSDRNNDSESSGSQVFAGQLFPSTTNNSDGDQESSSISLNLNVPIYSGGRTNAQVKESQHLYQQASHSLESARRLAVSKARSSYLGVVANVSSVNALKQAVISSEKSLEATQAGFEVGTRTIVDVLLQTQILFDSKRQYARSRYDYVLNTLKLKQATGLLTEGDLAKVNQLLR